MLDGPDLERAQQCSAGQHRWRYELAAAEGGTLVTETRDFTTSPWGERVAGSGWGRRDAEGIEQTLPRLKALVETGLPDRSAGIG